MKGGATIEVMKGDTRSLDYSSHGFTLRKNIILGQVGYLMRDQHKIMDSVMGLQVRGPRI